MLKLFNFSLPKISLLFDDKIAIAHQKIKFDYGSYPQAVR
jgi:hypothetical protein